MDLHLSATVKVARCARLMRSGPGHALILSLSMDVLVQPPRVIARRSHWQKPKYEAAAAMRVLGGRAPCLVHKTIFEGFVRVADRLCLGGDAGRTLEDTFAQPL